MVGASHELAREGVVVEREARQVTVHDLEILSAGPGPYPEVSFRVVCGKGTYVRSLADDMAAALGGSAHLTALRRSGIGSLMADDGIGLDDLENWESRLLTPSEALVDLAAVTVPDETANGVRHGVRFLGGEIIEAPEGAPYRVLNEAGDLIAVYQREGDQARPEVVVAT